MRLEALLVAAGLAVATAGSAAASPTNDDCEHKSWLAEIVCKAQQQAAPQPAKQQAQEDAWSLISRIMHPRTTFDWFRERFDQLGSKTMISSSTRPSTRPAATAPSDVGHR